MLDRTIAPDFKEVKQLTLISPQTVELENGCKIFSFNSEGQNLIRIEWIFRNLRFTTAKPLLNVAVNTLLVEGTKSRTNEQIADEIDFYGAFLQADYGSDYSQITLYTLNKHLAATLPVVKDVITNCVFPEKELQTFIRNQQQKLSVSLQKNDVLARRKFNHQLYPNTVYGLAPEAEDFAALNREDLTIHFQQQYQPANCTIIIAGKVAQPAINLISDTFGDWQNYITADFTQPEVAQTIGSLQFTERQESLQSAIRLGKNSITRNHPDFPGLQVLNTVFGGYFGSRLMTNIREDKGYTYGIGSGLVSHKKTGTFFIASEVGVDVCKATLTEIEKEINLLKDVLIPQGELSLVRNYMLGSLLGSLENIFSHADKFKNVYFSDLDFGYYDFYTKTVREITEEKLQQLAIQYFDFEQLTKVIVGKY